MSYESEKYFYYVSKITKPVDGSKIAENFFFNS